MNLETLGKQTMQPSLAQEARQAVLLLNEYAFELGWQEPTAQVLTWLETYRPSWIRDAVVEALHQGRYKAISVQQILALWQRRGQPVKHFTKEFERTIALPLGMQLTMSLPSLPTSATAATPSAVGHVASQDASQVSSEAQAQVAANGTAQHPAGLDDLSVWDEVTPPFSDTETVTPAWSSQPATRPKRAANQVALSAISTDRGVLTSTHQPIQPFRPQLPFPRHRRY